jgi:hypothetical protein
MCAAYGVVTASGLAVNASRGGPDAAWSRSTPVALHGTLPRPANSP